MKSIEDFADARNKSWCIHCRGWLKDLATNVDHIPSKSLLRAPYPDELPTIEVCRPCNSGFSSDEEYLVAFLGTVLCGSTDPERHANPRSAAILRHSPKLRDRIENAKTWRIGASGEKRLCWTPEKTRINRVILKNARGHALFEYGEPMLEEPDEIWTAPLEMMDAMQRAKFEDVAQNVVTVRRTHIDGRRQAAAAF
ncbi:MAG: hypothetical protein KUL86_14425 [Castellaniella sp.]|nr:hypothetical protein [Castellaniella sp.]